MDSKQTGEIENTAYSYNLRGWLTGLEGGYISERLHYEADPYGGAGCFNGNISAMETSSVTSSPSVNGHSLAMSGYSFTYDELDRLAGALYRPSPVPLGNTGIVIHPPSVSIPDYSESFTYDKMGSILTLKRCGLREDNSHGLIDNLTLSYNGCMPIVVDEAAGSQRAGDLMEFKDGYKGSGEYVHHNGKVYSDFNRKICSTRYNYLALPSRVQFRYGHRIDYVYDAAGVKRTTIHRESGLNMNFSPWEWYPEVDSSAFIVETRTDYIGNKVYVDNELKRILTGEGYIDHEDGNFVFHYHLRDHLGNVRVVVDESGSVVQATSYYPSGTVIAESLWQMDQHVQPYKFGGKELDRSYGLDFYDFVWRSYDPVLMRYTVPDPLQEKYPGISPYAYCGNNPVLYVDPTGEDYWSTNDPEQIRAFLNAVGSRSTQFDFSSGWNHMTDAQFADRLSYNDETGKYWISYGTVENGEAVVNARSFDANITPVSYSGQGYPGAFVYEYGSGNALARYGYSFLYDLTLFSDYISPIGNPSEYYDGTNTWSVNSKGRITGLKPNYTMGYPPAVGKGGSFKGGKFTQKMGKAKGNMSGNHTVQNQQAKAIAKQLGLKTEKEIRQLHDLISGQGYSYQEALIEAKAFFNK